MLDGSTLVSLISLFFSRNVVELGMSLVLMLVPFFPATGIVVRVGFVIAER